MQNGLSAYIKAKALDEGALLVGFTKIRQTEPVIVFGLPFTDDWFLKKPVKVAKLLLKDHAASNHVLDTTSKTLTKEGYRAHAKTIWSVYGDFRPLAVSAGLGDWGKNGIIVNRNFGAGLLFAALFTNAPLPAHARHTEHCTACGQCVQACPAQAFEGGFQAIRCLAYCLKGCSECLKICTAELH